MRTPDGHLFFISFTNNPQSLMRVGALGEIRTHNLLIRSQMLYPIELRVHLYKSNLGDFDFCLEKKLCRTFFSRIFSGVNSIF